MTGRILLPEFTACDSERSWKRPSTWTPELAFVHYDYGIVLEAPGEIKEAEAAYRTVQKLDPDHAGTCNNLGINLARAREALGH